MRTLLNFSGIGFEVGQSKSGLAKSPDFARQYFHYLNDAGIDLIDCGDFSIPNDSLKVKVHQNSDLSQIEWSKYQEVYSKTKEYLDSDYPLVNWGGDHSVALATVGAFLEKFQDGFVIWIDAHADLNLPEFSESGNFHGMPLAVLLNLKDIADEHFPWISHKLDFKKLIYIGLRDIDPFEVDVIESLGIKNYSFAAIEKKGIREIALEIKDIVGQNAVHISFDIDSIDPKFAPSTGVPVKYGLTPHDIDVLSVELFKKSNIRSVDIVEVNPELGSASQVDRTFLMALNFLSSVFNSNYPGDYHASYGLRSYPEQLT